MPVAIRQRPSHFQNRSRRSIPLWERLNDKASIATSSEYEEVVLSIGNVIGE
jgi:hypothetical protein